MLLESTYVNYNTNVVFSRSWKQGFVRWYVKKWTFSIFSTFHDSGVSMSSTYCFFPAMRTALGNSWLSWPFLHPLLSHLAQRATYAWAVHMHSEGSWMWAGLDLPTHCFFFAGDVCLERWERKLTSFWILPGSSMRGLSGVLLSGPLGPRSCICSCLSWPPTLVKNCQRVLTLFFLQQNLSCDD